MSHWQKVKLSHKEGKRKQEIENHFGIKTKPNKITKKEVKENLKSQGFQFKKSKKKSK